MLNMPVGEIKKKIQAQKGLSMDEIDARVAEKMKQLAGLISEEGAHHIVANELGVQLIPEAGNRKIADLLPGMRDVNQDVRVVQVYELRTFQSKFSEGEGKVCSFLAGDESGVIRVTAWGALAESVLKLKPQDVVSLKNGYIKDNNGRAELHLNEKSEIVVNPDGVTVGGAPQRSEEGQSQEYVRRKISELTRGDFRVELLGTVVQVYDPRFFERKDGGNGAVVNIMIDDGTGNIRVGCFDDHAAKALGLDLPKLLSRSDDQFEEEKTALLGAIVKVRGRAKLNTVYNSIELTADELDTEPDASAELGASQAVPAAKEAPAKVAATKAEQLEADKDAVPANASVKPAKGADDAVSLDELEDLDLDDLDED